MPFRLCLHAFGNLTYFAVCAREPISAIARVAINSVVTSAAMFARVARAIVDI